MTDSSFQPPKDQLGQFIKTKYGSTSNTASLVGLDESYNAVFSRGVALVQAVTPVYSKAYYWTSASFFTGIDTNLTSYITPVRDIASAMLAGLELIKSVLSILDTILSLGVNIFQQLVSRVTDLLTSILGILDLRDLSCHMLIIPPQVGNLGTLPSTTVNPKLDSTQTKNAKRSEKTRQDFVRYLSGLGNALPEALGADVSKLASQQNSSLAGSAYLLSTLRDKLNDTSDLGRPNLKEYSYSAGVGMFLGTSAINQFIEAWGKINSLFTGIDTSKFGFKGLPRSPIIASERINQANKLAESRTLTESEFSPTQFSVVVRPLAPDEYTTGSGVAYRFVRRVVLLDLPEQRAKSSGDFTKKIFDRLKVTDTLEFAATRGYIEDTVTYVTTIIENGSYVTRRGIYSEKLPTGKYHCIAIDFYTLDNTSPSKYLYLPSKVKLINITDDSARKYAGGLITARGYDSLTLDSSSKYPMWIAAKGSLALLPSVMGNLVEFVNYLKVTINSLLDDALSFLKILLSNLATVIEVYKAILTKVDQLIELIQFLMSLTSSLGVSVMSFHGSGDASALYSAFEEYLDPNTSSTTNLGPPQERDIINSRILEEATRLQNFSDQVEAGLLPEAIIRNGTSYLDPTGSINIVNGERKIVQDEELQAILGDNDPNTPSVTTAWNSSYNMSPIFTDEMTCGGIILLAHSHIEKNLASFQSLLDLLFKSEENPTAGDQGTLLADKGLQVDLPNLRPDLTLELVQEPQALFTEDMQLTEDPTKSPFDFCP